MRRTGYRFQPTLQAASQTKRGKSTGGTVSHSNTLAVDESLPDARLRSLHPYFAAQPQFKILSRKDRVGDDRSATSQSQQTIAPPQTHNSPQHQRQGAQSIDIDQERRVLEERRREYERARAAIFNPTPPTPSPTTTPTSSNTSTSSNVPNVTLAKPQQQQQQRQTTEGSRPKRQRGRGGGKGGGGRGGRGGGGSEAGGRSGPNNRFGQYEEERRNHSHHRWYGQWGAEERP
jgi:hypothetical protein